MEITQRKSRTSGSKPRRHEGVLASFLKAAQCRDRVLWGQASSTAAQLYHLVTVPHLARDLTSQGPSFLNSKIKGVFVSALVHMSEFSHINKVEKDGGGRKLRCGVCKHGRDCCSFLRSRQFATACQACYDHDCSSRALMGH